MLFTGAASCTIVIMLERGLNETSSYLQEMRQTLEMKPQILTGFECF
jgi:hypothetical protein